MSAAPDEAGSVTIEPWDETWRPIADTPGYEVSDHGNVRSYLKKGNHKRKHAGRPRLLKLQHDSSGRATVSLPKTDSPGYRHRRVHRLVAQAFLGPCPEGMEVAHLNGDHTDNRASNLVYATHRENESHKKLHGTSPVGERNGAARLLGWQVAEIKFLADKGIPQARTAALFAVSPQAVHDVLTGHIWPHIAARSDVPRLLAALDAALSHHQRIPLYGNASTEDEPDACPHDPDAPEHFESADEAGEWLCGGKPEGAVCSCTATEDGERIPYPCDEVADILAALTGKQEGNA